MHILSSLPFLEYFDEKKIRKLLNWDEGRVKFGSPRKFSKAIY